MYKKIFLVIIISIFTMVLTSCSQEEKNSVQELSEKSESIEEKPIDYKIDQIVLSKGFQITDTNVDIIEKGTNLKLLVTAGVVESSGVDVDRITMTGNTLNIYLTRKMEEDKVQLAVPQITLEINTDLNSHPEDINFNIIANNYEPISLKFNKNQIIDRICTELKIEPTTVPKATLYKADNNILWNVYFPYQLDKENIQSPLFNLNVEANAATGEILDKEKVNVSTYLDHGHILDYMPNELLVYKQENIENGIPHESLWTYSLKNDTKKKLYTTKHTIKSSLISPDGKYISLIESDESKSDVFLIDRAENLTIKITPTNNLHGKLMKWKDKNSLYLVDVNNDKSTLYLYNVSKKAFNIVMHLDKIVESFDVLGDKIIFTEHDEYLINKNIYLVEKDDKLNLIGKGFKPILFDDKHIIYLENLEEKNLNRLQVYNIEKNAITDTFSCNILDFYRLDDNNLLFIENLNLNNQFNFGKYNVKDKSSTAISQINSNKLYYNQKENKAYISLTIPTKEKNVYNIYSIDLSKVNSNTN